MTHLWPNMVRKPRHALEPDLSPSVDQETPLPRATAFPVTFEANGAAGPSSKGLSFPSLAELEAELGVDDEIVERLGRMEMLEEDDWDVDDFGPDQEEYARLDEWLDEEDGDADGLVDEGELSATESHSAGPPEGLDADQTDSTSAGPQPRNDEPPDREAANDTGALGHSGFEDDFSEFQSASQDGSSLPLDPTPLLLHLQSVRAELADVEDEDERRLRAGREVEMIMRTLGMEVGGLDDLDDLDDGIS